jgi:predicted ATPase
LLHYLKDQDSVRLGEDGAWCETGDLSWSGLPARVEGVISERIARLSEEEREMLSAASILGESFHAEVLSEMIRSDTRSNIRLLSGSLAKKHALVQALGFDRKANLRLSGYEFRHNLIHRYFYESLDPIERGFLHEEAAQALESLFGDNCSEVAVQLAHHFTQAEQHDRAVEYLYQAGREAHRGLAHTEARSHYQAALDTMGKAGSELVFSDQRFRQLRLDIRIALADILVLEGEFSAARELYEGALESTPSGDRLQAVRLLSRIATTHEREHQHELALLSLQQAAERLDDGFDDSNAEELSEWITIRASRLWLYYWQGDLEGMAQVVEEAEQVVEEQGDLSQKRKFYTGVAGLGNRRDRFFPSDATLEASQSALQAALASDKLIDRADAAFGTGFISMLRNELEHSEELLTQSLQLASRYGDRTLQARCLTYLAMLYRRQKRADQLREITPQAIEICRVLGMHEYIGVIEACSSWLAMEKDDLGRAEELAVEALESWQKHAPGYPFKWLALLPLIRITLSQNAGLGKAVEHAKAVLTPPNASFAGSIEKQLENAVAAFEAGDLATAQSTLEQSLTQAVELAYL